MRKAAYVAVAIVLAVFGFLALFSIGFPFLLTGLVMLALTPRRQDVAIIIPALVWPCALTLGYVLVAPLGCRTLSIGEVRDGVGTIGGSTTCHAVFFSYAGDVSYSPPTWPAILVGVTFATGVAFLIRSAIIRRRSVVSGDR
jgi:hypothetical protein